MSKPDLAPPGAGIPTPERMIGRYVILPYHQWRYGNWDSARRFMLSSLDTFQAACRDCPPALAETAVLIPRLTGLEDSSRYWSVAQVVEHLAIVDSGIAKALPRLAAGESEFQQVSTAEVKPAEQARLADADTGLTAAISSLRDATLQPIVSPATLSHPWFGPLTAKEWLVMTGIHHNLHRNQVVAITKALQAGNPG